MLLRNIQVKLGCYSLRSYDPPEELAFEVSCFHFRYVELNADGDCDDDRHSTVGGGNCGALRRSDLV